jgi:hypothetical protein
MKNGGSLSSLESLEWGTPGTPATMPEWSRVMMRGLTRPVNSQIVHRMMPRVLKREFLLDESVNL